MLTSNPAGRVRWVWFAVLALFVGGILAAGARNAAAQAAKEDAASKPAKYKQMKVVDSAERKKERAKVNQILHNAAFANAEERQMFEDYYQNYALPRWTLTDDKKLAAIATDFWMRELRLELQNAKGGEPRAMLLQNVLKIMSDIVKDEAFHPVVRYNAMLAIGYLNEQEAEAGHTHAVPLPAGLRILSSAVKDADQIDALRVATLVGLVRHCREGIANEADRNAVMRSLLAVATTADPPAGRTQDGHGWMRMLAVDALAGLKQVGTNNSVATALATIVADKAAPLSVRTAATRALGGLNYQGANGLKPKDLAVTLAQFAAAATLMEIRRKIETTAAPTPGASGLMGMGSRPAGPGYPGSMSANPGYPGSKSPGSKSPGSKSPGSKSPGSKSPGSSKSGSSMMGPSGSMPPTGMMSGMGGATGGEEQSGDEAAEIFRRRLKVPLMAVRNALGQKDSRNGAKSGLLSLTSTANDESFFAFVTEEINKLYNLLDDENSVYAELKPKVGTAYTALAKKLKDPDAAFAAWQKDRAAKEAARTKKK